MRVFIISILIRFSFDAIAQQKDTTYIHYEPCSQAYLPNQKAYIEQYLAKYGFPDSAYLGMSSIKVYVELRIDTLGNVINPKIKRGYNVKFDMVALDIVKRMPTWKPAVCYGRKEEMRMVLPITFKST